MRKLLYIVLVVVFVGCGTSTLDCTYKVRPYVQQTTDDALDIVNHAAIGYGFYADTALWAVASFEDAHMGIITRKSDNQKRGYDLLGEKDLTGAIEFRLLNGPVILIVCDPVEKIYAWRHAAVVDNLATMNVPVYFRPWRRDPFYIDTRWDMVNEFLPASI